MEKEFKGRGMKASKQGREEFYNLGVCKME